MVSIDDAASSDLQVTLPAVLLALAASAQHRIFQRDKVKQSALDHDNFLEGNIELPQTAS